MEGMPSETAITAWARLLRAAETALDGVQQDLKRAGLPPLAWYDVLLELGRESRRGKGLRQRDLQAEMLLTSYNLSRLIDRMETKGLVRREPCVEDGRGALVVVTDKGRALKRRMWPIYAKAIAARFSERFAEAELAALAELLRKLR
jgi:DNA-binding MarR family transcriptional regulator